jgi:DNA-binding IclR family transcriptional regulator
VRDTSGQFVAGMNVILGRPMAETDMVARFLQPLQSAAAELGSLLLP